MKKWAMLLLLTSSVFASEGESNLSYSRVSKGNFSLSGSAGGGYSTGGYGLNGHLDLSSMYYILDNLAIGVDTSLSYYSGADKIFGYVGPSIQYNFYNSDLLTAYAKLSYMTDITNPLRNNQLRGDLGADFWLGKTVSIGPYLRTIYAFDRYTPELNTAVGGRLGFHF